MAGIPLGSAAEDEIRQRISITTEAPGLYNQLTVACFGVARLFDRERLVTGTRPSRSAPAAVAAPGTARRLPPVSGTS